VFTVDQLDYQAIQDAVAVRKSGFFAVDGELMLPDGESDERGACLAEICRYFSETIHRDRTPSRRDLAVLERTLRARRDDELGDEPEPFHSYREAAPDAAYLHEHRHHEKAKRGEG
jgi:hypothetical protein